MKKLLLFTTIAMLLMSSCTNSNTDDQLQKCTVSLPESISASTEAFNSRTEANSSNQVIWDSGDHISLFPGADCNIDYRLTAGSRNIEGKFERVTTETKASGIKLNGYYAVYPYSEQNTISPAGDIRLTIPATQKYTKGSFSAGSNVMVAKESNQSPTLQFKSVGGFLKVLLYGTNATVKTLSISGNNGEKIAGTATVVFAKDGTPEIAMAEDAETSISIDCYNGVALGKSAETATAFWFVLPAMTFEKGYTISVTDTNNVLFTKKISGPVTIERSTLLTTEVIKTKLSGDGLEMVDGKVRFYLSEDTNGIRTKAGLPARDWATSSVVVNSKTYPISFDEDEIPYIDVDFNSANIYAASLVSPESANCYGDTPYVGIRLSHAQLYHKAKSFVAAFPMYASYSMEAGNRLIFHDAFALLHFKLKGTAKIASINVENLSGGVIAGPATVNRNTESISLSRGMSFISLNCTNNGNFAPLNTSTATDFYIMAAPKPCAKGLKVSICDSERLAMFKELDITELEAGKLYTIEEDYAPESDLTFYEGFDNMVWGGDIVKGSAGKGYSPDDTTIDIGTNANRTGYEEALTEVPYNNPGSCFIQSNTWSEVSGELLATSHQVSDSYVKSRNLDGYQYMFRAQEHPGYIAVGAATTARGIFSSPMMTKMTGIGTIKVCVQFALQALFDGTLQVGISCGGIIKEAKLNGANIALTTDNLNYDATISSLKIPNSQLNIATSVTLSKPWNTLELTVENVADGSRVYITDLNSSTGVHGIYIDSIEAHKISEVAERGPNTLRVLLWNIQNGMWADQHNGYNTFVKWVKKYDPDICIWCESETIYIDKTNKSMSEADRYLPNGWQALCQRYGHSYAATGGNRDNYSQTVTSKYPITTIAQIVGPSSKPISHGAGHFTIMVNGKKIHIVSLHMWPQQYKYGVTGDAKREESAAKKEGDYYRQYEMQYIVDATVNHSSYSNEELWLFGGDTNSRSRKDAWYYSYSADDPKYLTHDVILNQTKLKDVIADYYPSNYFFTSTAGTSRIDMLYASPAMFNRIISSTTLMDSWSNTLPIHDLCKSWSSNKFRDPSDHRPILVDFNME
ncbi:MAG: metal-dependent hydrolase [Rikenellaceae bacterium]|nr:metal-dependent hydrolase [Rikenellaceae bacterium]